MNNKARFLPFVIALALLAAIFVLPHASSAAAGTVKLSSNFTTTPDGNLAVTVADADLNTGVVQTDEADDRFELTGAYPRLSSASFPTDKAPFLDATPDELGSGTSKVLNGFVDETDVVVTYADLPADDQDVKHKAWIAMTRVIPGNVDNKKRHPARVASGQIILSPAAADANVGTGNTITFTATYKGPDVQYSTVNISSTQDSTGINLRLEETGAQTGEFKFDGGFDTNTAYTTHMVKLDGQDEAALGLKAGTLTKGSSDGKPIPLEGLQSTTGGSWTVKDGTPIAQTVGIWIKDPAGGDLTFAPGYITYTNDIEKVVSLTEVRGEKGEYKSFVSGTVDASKFTTGQTSGTVTISVTSAAGDNVIVVLTITLGTTALTPGATEPPTTKPAPATGTTTTEVALKVDLDGDNNSTDTELYEWLDITKVTGARIPTGDKPPTLGYRVGRADDTTPVTTCEAGGTLITHNNDVICDVGDGTPTIKAIDGSQITASYSDGGTNRTDNATVEVQNPTINIIGPAHGESTRVRGARLIAELTDADSGIDESSITFVVQPRNVSGVNEDPQRYQDGYNLDGKENKDKDVVTTVSIAGGVRAEVQLADIGSGETKVFWTVHVKDTAGNRAVADRDATDDDALDLNDDPTKRTESVDCTATLDDDKNNMEKGYEPDCFRLRIDTLAPKLGSTSIDHDGIEDNALKPITGAITGNYLDDEGKAVENAKKASKTSIRVIFNEALNGDSLQANDFRVNSIAPVGVSFSSKHPKSAFLTVPDMVSNLKPTVEVTGDVEDAAGNVRPGGESTTGADGISPSIGITVSPSYAQEQVTIDIITDEPLLTVPSITLNGEKRTDLNGLGAVTLVATNHYRATVKPTGAGALESYNIEVTGSDTSSNPQSAGKAATHDDAILFEIDNALPKPARVALPGKDVVAEPATDSGDAKYGGDAVGITTMNPFITIDWTNEGTEYTNPEAIAAVAAVAAVADDPKTPNVDETVVAVEGVEAVKAVDADTHGAVDVTNLTIGGVAITTPVGDETGSVTNDGDATYVVSRKSENELLISARGLALGVYEISFNGADELGNTLKDDIKVKFEVKAPAPFKVPLTPGWNLISLPANPIDGDINTLIGADHPIQTVSTYDPTQAGGWLTSTRGADGAFEGTIETISARTAYWVFTNGFDALEVDITRQSGGQVQALPTINLVAGWNLLPVLDVTGSKAAGDEVDDVSGATRVYSYDSGTSSFIAVTGDPRLLKVGSGYWVYLSKAAVLVP